MTAKHSKTYLDFAPCDVERVLALRASNVGGLGRSHVDHTCTPSSPPAVPSAPLQTDLFHSRTAIRPFEPQKEGRSDTGDTALRATRPGHVLIGYEMSRLGYVVFGGQFLQSFDDWYIVTSLVPLRSIETLWNYRVVVLDVERHGETDAYYRIVGPPRLCRVDDPMLRAIPWYHMTVCAFE